MDDAVVRERRAELARRVRRRRRAVVAGALVALLGLVVALATAGNGPDRKAQPQTAPVRAPAVATPHAPEPRTIAMPGAHRAPHEAVPILMYHVIGNRRPGTPNPTLWVSPKDFGAHVRALSGAGYHGVTLEQVWSAWHHHGELPSRPIVLSFDDGYLGQVRYALPTLAGVGWPGVLNLKLGNLKDMGGTSAIERMIRARWEIDSHTITHPDLTTVGAQQRHDELVVSRARLKRYFHTPVGFFCYPSGRYDDAVIAAVKAAGYHAATTTEPGWARPGGDPFTLARVRIDGGMSAPAVLRRVRDLNPKRAA